ncbi:unnamed protein product [Paramecium sonneborni]|uniref:Uncharacterized protein n=1 Tax=Paramecium sonneborni TaxID=65129 RepID=A0A8S1JVF8_9CILI|nr:unnamed protein product [Paramecium sonneborni]
MIIIYKDRIINSNREDLIDEREVVVEFRIRKRMVEKLQKKRRSEVREQMIE